MKKIYTTPRPDMSSHKCDLPKFARIDHRNSPHQQGDVLQCEECGKRWVKTEYWTDSYAWTPLRPWHESFWKLYFKIGK